MLIRTRQGFSSFWKKRWIAQIAALDSMKLVYSHPLGEAETYQKGTWDFRVVWWCWKVCSIGENRLFVASTRARNGRWKTMITFGWEIKRGCFARSGADRSHYLIMSFELLRDILELWLLEEQFQVFWWKISPLRLYKLLIPVYAKFDCDDSKLYFSKTFFKVPDLCLGTIKLSSWKNKADNQ